MKSFEYKRAESFAQAGEMLAQKGKNVLIAGGTDLIGGIKERILPDSPDALIDIKRIPASADISAEDGTLKIGALATLTRVVESDAVKQYAPLLAEAAKSVATPLIRNRGTIGGNVCQDVRCWFYRYPHETGGRLLCARKGGDRCYACQGDSRSHSVFGGMKAHTTACSSACPAGTDIPAYMQKIREGNWDAAARIILRVNPLPMLTSRVCPHPCQTDCNRNEDGDSVNIRCVERSVGDYILENIDKYYQAPVSETGKSIAVVGGGPAGLTAAYYLRRQGHKVTVYDKMQEAGGVLMYGIPEYRLPKHYVRTAVKAIADMGVVFRCDTEVGKDIKIEEIESANDSVFLDTGAWKQPLLGLDGEKLTQFGLNFLVEVKRFMSRQIGKNVLVCGGGNVAMDVALTAVRLGAEEVTMACLEQREEMPASAEEIARAIEEGVKIINGRGLSKVIYEGDKVVGMETNRCVAVRDDEGRFNPQYDNSDMRLLKSDSIILATGQRVDLDFLGDKFKDEVKSARGLIEVGEHNETRKAGVYAGGDAATGPDVAIRAIRAGANAAKNIGVYLGYSAHAHEGEWNEGLLSFDREGIRVQKSHKPRELPVSQRNLTDEDEHSFEDGVAAEEAKRCMNCGCYAVDPSDIAPALMALDATVVTTERRIKARDFCSSALRVSDRLLPNEVVESFEIPIVKGAVMHYDKFRLRKSVDFAIVSVASLYSTENGRFTGARIILGGVAPVPVEAREAAGYLIGKTVGEETAEAAAKLAVKNAVPFDKNRYKLNELEALLKASILRL
jgi:NADPH-dependent glutamate synthase beta subunit-like oxidoreductase